MENIITTEAELLFAIEANELATWSLNPKTGHFIANNRLKEWFGLKSEDEIPLTLAIEAIVEKDRQRVSDAIARAMEFESGGRYDIEYSIHSPGSDLPRFVKAKGRAWFDENNVVYRMSGTLQDVTIERSAMAAIEKSEAHLQLLSNTVPAMIFYLDTEQRYLSYNDVFMKWFNVNATGAIGLKVRDFIGETAYAKAEGYLAKAYSGQQVQYHMYAPQRIGGDKWLSIVYTPHKNPDGEVIGVIVHATDITEHIRTQQQIAQKEKELRDLITASPIGICVVSGSPLRVEEVNERFLQVSGKTREEYANAPYWEVLEEVAPIFQPILEGVFKSGQKYTTEENEMVLVRDGVPENIFLTFEYIPVIEQEKVRKVIVMVVEVTHQAETRKKIEQAVIERTRQLADSNIQLKRSNEELEQFAYIASHDLQEPIRKISTFAQMLEFHLSETDAKTKEYFEKIYRSTDRMSSLIRDVLAFSGINTEDNIFEPVDLNQVIKLIEMDFEILIEETKAKIITKELPIVFGNLSQLQQMFGNLMSNSLKYIQAGRVPQITILAKPATAAQITALPNLNQSKNYHHIIFTDNGIGFKSEYADQIFKIFQRLHSKEHYPGTGIGLSIVRKIIQVHGGYITAMPSEESGAIFDIFLPVIG